MTKTIDAHYDNPKLAAIYDYDSGWSVDREFYLSLSGHIPLKILDLGCGTGLICDAYAKRGHQVTGVDPAQSMLEIARNKPNGQKIQWIQSFAQDYSSDNLYDLIIMTGHAFQVLLEEADIKSTFEVMRKHLAVGGRIVFESRNPDIDWSSRWNTKSDFDLPNGRVCEERQVIKTELNYIYFKTSYHFPHETLVSDSKLRFWTLSEIESYLISAGLKIEKLYGDWDESPYIPKDSEEMVFVVKRLEP